MSSTRVTLVRPPHSVVYGVYKALRNKGNTVGIPKEREIKPPLGLPSPYSLVYVDLTAVNLRVFGLFDPNAAQDLRIGLEVELDVGPLGVDINGQPCLRPYFTPRKTHENRK